MFSLLSFLMSLLHSIPFKHAMHFLACITLDLISLSSVPIVSKVTPKYLLSRQNSISLSSSNHVTFISNENILFILFYDHFKLSNNCMYLCKSYIRSMHVRMGRYEAFEVSMYLCTSLYAIYVRKYQHALPSVFSSVPTAKCEDFFWLDFVAARKAK
jgi:hypothetical protein